MSYPVRAQVHSCARSDPGLRRLMERFVSKAFLATIILSVHATSSENAEFAPLSAALSATSAVVAPHLVSMQSSGDQEDLTSLHLSSALSAS